VMVEYKITIGHKGQGSQQARRGPRGKLEILKAALLTLVVLSAIVGVFLAAFVVGSIIASVLLILLVISVMAWVIRRFLLRFRRKHAKS
jgi:uncharacterized protein (DUF2062 family)